MDAQGKIAEANRQLDWANDLQEETQKSLQLTYEEHVTVKARRDYFEQRRDELQARWDAEIDKRVQKPVELGNKVLELLISSHDATNEAKRKHRLQARREAELDTREAKLRERELIMNILTNDVNAQYAIDIPALYGHVRNHLQRV